jgi:hypothetical protein
MMKTLFKFLSTVALALVLFVPAKNAFSDSNFPAGVSFSHIVGAVLDPQDGVGNGPFTTLDAIDFGFWTRYVRICLRPQSQVSYFRFATTVSQARSGIVTPVNLMTVPASSSNVFIQGSLASDAVASSFDWGALSMMVPISSDGAASNFDNFPTCMTQPWKTRGIVMHIVSGFATADVWGYR